MRDRYPCTHALTEVTTEYPHLNEAERTYGQLYKVGNHLWGRNRPSWTCESTFFNLSCVVYTILITGYQTMFKVYDYDGGDRYTVSVYYRY